MNKSLNVVWEFEKDAKKFVFVVPYGANYAEVYEAMNAIAEDIKESEKVAIAQMEEQKKREEEQKSESSDVASDPIENAVA